MTRERSAGKSVRIGDDTFHYFFGWDGCFNFFIDDSETTGQSVEGKLWEHVCDLPEFIAKLTAIAAERPQNDQ